MGTWIHCVTPTRTAALQSPRMAAAAFQRVLEQVFNDPLALAGLTQPHARPERPPRRGSITDACLTSGQNAERACAGSMAPGGWPQGGAEGRLPRPAAKPRPVRLGWNLYLDEGNIGTLNLGSMSLELCGAMDDCYTIGQLARHAGVPTSTVRYYERRGLLSPQRRSQGNYRLYGEYSLDRLRFVRSAQGAGFTLADITALLQFRDGDVAPCGEVQALITARLDSLGAQIGQFQHVQKLLRRWLRVCRDAERTGRCGVLAALSACHEESCTKSSNCSSTLNQGSRPRMSRASCPPLPTHEGA